MKHVSFEGENIAVKKSKWCSFSGHCFR